MQMWSKPFPPSWAPEEWQRSAAWTHWKHRQYGTHPRWLALIIANRGRRYAHPGRRQLRMARMQARVGMRWTPATLGYRAWLIQA